MRQATSRSLAYNVTELANHLLIMLSMPTLNYGIICNNKRLKYQNLLEEWEREEPLEVSLKYLHMQLLVTRTLISYPY